MGSLGLVLLLALVAYGQKITLPGANVKTGKGTLTANGLIDVDLAVYDVVNVHFNAYRHDGTKPGQVIKVDGANLNLDPLKEKMPKPGTWKASFADLDGGQYSVYARVRIKNKATNAEYEYNTKTLPPFFVGPK
jgi:hypothetical protein